MMSPAGVWSDLKGAVSICSTEFAQSLINEFENEF